ncbi:cytochrome b561 [Novosphingobium sp. SG751A]|uniref:cytochrome b n=1 Tax=Novosphingobium sp. SG751A TaxID=2587000 RepID=UPI001552A76D|nr:cytochrome b [Novosphingobium sp. SG751A]NOW45876.1 cytochrome b561 [Novosphingobium sp. SG751A]
MGASVESLRYSAVAMVLHWLVAGFLLANLALGWWMKQLIGLDQFEAFQLHKSIGMSVLALSILRLLWRVSHRAPALPETMNALERFAAHATHLFFYAMMILMPLTGWALVSVSPFNIPTLLWHTIPLPHIAMLHDLAGPARATAGKLSGGAHVAMAFGGAALIGLHVAAALKHQFINRDGVLGRMVPFLSATPR